MSTCLIAASPTATCQSPGSPTGTVDIVPGGPGGGGVIDIITPPGSVVSPPGSITFAFVSDDRTATLIGFDEYVSPSTPPKKYRRQEIAGTLNIDKTSANNTCASTNPGSGQQSGDFTVFYFVNEVVNGVVNCTLDSIDFDANLANYTFTSADWSEVSVMFVDRDTTDWSPMYGASPVGLPYSFSVTLGTTFTIGMRIQAISGYGVGSWVYEAGRETFVDNWSQFGQYHAVTGVFSSGVSNTRTPTGGAIPDRNSGVTLFQPELVYVPVANLLFQLEPTYISTSTDSSTVKTILGLGCCPTVSGFGRQSINCVGSITTTLSDEDLEDDAWDRATPSLGTSNVARYELRGAGDFTFVRTDVEVEITTDNLQIGTNYRVLIPITTANYDGTSPVDSVVNLDFTASASSELVSQSILATRGKQVTVGTPTLIIV